MGSCEASLMTTCLDGMDWLWVACLAIGDADIFAASLGVATGGGTRSEITATSTHVPNADSRGDVFHSLQCAQRCLFVLRWSLVCLTPAEGRLGYRLCILIPVIVFKKLNRL